MNKIVLFVFLFPFTLSAQLPWRTEIGLGAGIMTYEGDLEPQRINAGLYNQGPAGMIGIRQNLHNMAAFRLQAAAGILRGNDNRFPASDPKSTRGFSFSSPVFEGTLRAEIYPLGMFRTQGRVQTEDGSRLPRKVMAQRRLVAPFGSVGIGAVYFNTKPDFNLNSDGLNPYVSKARINTDVEAQKGRVAVSMPMGGGLRFRISNRATFDLEAYTRLVASDYLDGVSLSGNPEQNDWFFTAMAAFHYAVSKGKSQKPASISEPVADTSADEERTPRKKDRKKRNEKKNPEETGETTPDKSAKKGNADRDGDGVADTADECPDDKGLRVLKGCPDRDKDGVADLKDNCPDTPGRLNLAGCPDGDGDGVPDKDDACPQLAGTATYRGCPPLDRDKDGVADAEDLCPDMPGELKWQGCADNDGDGIPDHKDECPGIPGTEAGKGCPDGDGDGVADKDDACPTVPGIAAKKGCPESATAQGVHVPYKAVYFNSQKKDWYETSYTTLQEVVQMMQDNPVLQLRIEGNTDNTGDGPANSLLSEQRARQCFDYLVSKGVSAKRMTYMGFADRRPVATNMTKEGRQLNRRVEIHFYQ